MRVVLLSFGFEEYCIQQANGLARDCEVLLLLPRQESAEYAPLLDPTVQYHPFDKPRLRQPTRQMKLAASLMRRIHEFQPDVVHYQQGHLWFNFALPLLRTYPLVVTIHDPRHHAGDVDSQRTPQGIMNFGFRRADHVVVHGEILKREVIELFRFPEDNVHVIPHVAIGTTDVSSSTDIGPPTVLFFGRIWPYKGLQYLIQAEPLIRRAVPDAQIVIAGVGEDFEPYRRLMERPERFIVHNRQISAGDCDQLFRQASIVVLPYIEATQSGVIPLAYSYAKPVVASNVGALAEAVDDRITGLLVPPADVPALSSAVVELLQDSKARCEMGLAGRLKLETEWSPQTVGRQAMEVYRCAINDRRGVAQPAVNHTERSEPLAPCRAERSGAQRRISEPV